MSRAVTPEQWEQVEAAFHELGLAPAEARAAKLVSIADDEVRRELTSRLERSSSSDAITAVIGSAATAVAAATSQQRRIGPYRIGKRLGQGGQGAIFEGVRDDGNFQQRVAIKIVKWELDTDEARARFRLERQILAGLEHPNIARLLDGGQIEDGAPYFVMEYIEGLPLTEATRDWPRKRKLEIFMEVSAAVAYAHRNLIVHRDLKPANILVTAEGTPKLLDFGIAKLIQPDVTRSLTGVSLTPDYASPEQVSGLPISTASDIYSLGVVLYQLLTDRKPYKLDTMSLVEMDRVICREPPVPPGLGDELDYILLTALRKEPERRYSTVEQFVDDIQRYLDHRPVSAQPDTLWYRTRKYARRHWLVLTAAGAVALAVVGGTAATLRQAGIAEQRFNQVRELAHRFIFDFNDQVRPLPGSTGAREMIVKTALDYLDNLSRGAHGDPGLEWEIAKAYEKVAEIQGSTTQPSLGHTGEATQLYKKSAAMQEQLAARGYFDAAKRDSLSDTYAKLSGIYRVTGPPSEAVKTAELSVAHARMGSEHAQAGALSALALAKNYAGEPAAALEAEKQAREIMSREAGRESDWGAAHIGLAAINLGTGIAAARLARYEEAADYVRQAIAIREQGLAEQKAMATNTRELVLSYYALADILGGRDRFSLGRTEESVIWYRKALALAERLTSSDTKNANSRMDLALAQGKLGDALEPSAPAESLRLYEEALAVAEAQLPEGAFRDKIRSAAYRSMAGPLAKLGRMEDARAKLAAAMLIDEAAFEKQPKSGPNVSDIGEDWLVRGEIERGQNASVALDAYRKALELATRTTELTPRDFSAAFLEVRTLEEMIALLKTKPGSELTGLRQSLVALWTHWDQTLPGSPFIQQKLKAALENDRH
jgi:eukaryotic-like serine/threonine-protein kinase